MANAWFTGGGAPAADLGEDTDHFLDIDTSRVFRKSDNTWRLVGILRAAGRGPTWLSGSGTPTAQIGDNGDMFLDVDAGRAFQKVADSWVFVSDLRGMAGAAGATPASFARGNEVEIPLFAPGVDPLTLAQTTVPEAGPAIVLAKFIVFYSGSPNISSPTTVTASLAISATTLLDVSEVTLTSSGLAFLPPGLVSIAGAISATVSLTADYDFSAGQAVRLVASRTQGTPGDRVTARHIALAALRHT